MKLMHISDNCNKIWNQKKRYFSLLSNYNIPGAVMNQYELQINFPCLIKRPPCNNTVKPIT